MKLPWWIILLGAVAATILFNLTNILVLVDVLRNGGIYNYFTFLNPDALINLAPMLRDVLDGHLRISDGRVAEHVLLPSLWSNVTPLLFAPFVFAFGSVPFGYFAAKIATVLVSFPLLYLVARRLTGNARAAFIFSLVFFGPTLLWLHLFPVSRDDLSIVAHTLLPIGGASVGALMSKYNSFSVAPTMPIFLAIVLFLLIWLQEKKLWAAVCAGLALGALASTYATSAVYLGAALGVLIVGAAVRRSWVELRGLVIVGAAAVPTAAYFLYNFFSIRTLPYAAEFYDRLGGDITHAFRWSRWPDYLWYVGLAVAVTVLGRRAQSREAARLVTSLLVAGIIVWNIHVVTGYNPAPVVWRIHQIYFGLALAGCVLLTWGIAEVRRRSRVWARAAAGVLVAFAASALVQTVRAEVALAREQAPLAAIPPAIEASFAWIDEHAARDAVFASPSLVSHALLPLRTHARVLTPRAITSPASQEEIIDRWLAAYALFGVPAAQVEVALRGTTAPVHDPYARDAENGQAANLYEYAFRSHDLDAFFRPFKKAIPEDAVRALLARYEATPKDLPTLMATYRLDYLYVGPYEQRMAGRDFDAAPELTKVYDAAGVRIYAL